MSVFVVIPCYRVSAHICDVIEGLGSEVDAIIVIDDCCPEESGALVEKTCDDTRVRVIYHTINLGVGGAVLTGYQAAIEAGAGVIVKIDGDGQMDASLIPNFIEPLLSGEADYTKGNRFYDLEEVRAMPKVRLFGNAVLSLMTKLSSGYWNLFDPTNGYTAIHASVASHLPFKKISRSYFFEADILFRLNTLRAVVIDVPMSANYGDEISNLKIPMIIGEFILKHAHYFTKQLALSLLDESGYSIIDASYTRAAFTAPSRSWRTLIARPLRRLIYTLFGRDRGVRLVGGETLIVLAQSQTS